MFEGASKAHSQAMQQHQQHQYLQQMHHQSGQMNPQSVNHHRHVSPAPSPSGGGGASRAPSHSSANVPDYTQVSPAKMALRRHLSQEKLATPVVPKTIGDLVNGEIERTLEISHQSIINAAVNMSTTHPLPVEVFNVQRPERVNVRGPEDYHQYANFRGQDMRRSPVAFGQSHENPKLSSSGKGSGNLFMANYATNSLNTFGYSGSSSGGGGGGGGSRESSQSSSCLPRADMKPYLEQYFLEEQFGKSKSSQQSRGNPSVPRGGGGEEPDHRMSVPYEGLAASLQARVRATLNIKEEPELMGRSSSTGPKLPLHHQHIKQEGERRGDGNVKRGK